MGGCATKQAATEAEMKEEAEAVEVVQEETKGIEGGRKSLSLLFMENKKEKMKEATEFDVPLEQKPAQNAPEKLRLVHHVPTA